MSLIFSTDLYRCQVRLEVYDGPAWYLVLLRCPRITPRRHRQADGQLSPLYPPLPSLSLFGAACVKLSGLSPPWLDRTTVAAVSSSLHRRKNKFAILCDVLDYIHCSTRIYDHRGWDLCQTGEPLPRFRRSVPVTYTTCMYDTQ